jgi:hypothetical protein
MAPSGRINGIVPRRHGRHYTAGTASALSKLETERRANPTVETLVRYAEAVGLRLVVSLADTER